MFSWPRNPWFLDYWISRGKLITPTLFLFDFWILQIQIYKAYGLTGGIPGQNNIFFIYFKSVLMLLNKDYYKGTLYVY